jgi:hypothetical protein
LLIKIVFSCFVFFNWPRKYKKKRLTIVFIKKNSTFAAKIKKLQTKKMKKLILMAGIIGMFSVVACGPSAEEIAKKEQAKADSIAAVEKARLDSIAAAQEKMIADSIASAKEKAIADSIAAAEEMAAAKKKGGKPAPKKKDEPKANNPRQGSVKEGSENKTPTTNPRQGAVKQQ